MWRGTTPGKEPLPTNPPTTSPQRMGWMGVSCQGPHSKMQIEPEPIPPPQNGRTLLTWLPMFSWPSPQGWAIPLFGAQNVLF